MQSGRGGVKSWILEYEPSSALLPNPLMGWTSSKDTLNQVRLRFPTQEEAVAFAERKGWPFEIVRPNPRQVTPKTYVSKFLS